MLVGNKIDLLESMNTKPINPLDELTWKVIAQEKLTKAFQRQFEAEQELKKANKQIKKEG